MKFNEFKSRSSFSFAEIKSYARGELLEDIPEGLPKISDFLLLPFHEIESISWDESSQTGRIVCVRRNQVDDWFYSCHFVGDPVMPGCWGLDAVWQAMKFFAAWRGLSGCDKDLEFSEVVFSGQIRPYDPKIVYAVDIQSIEKEGSDFLMSASASVFLGDALIYSIGSAQIGSAFWEKSAEDLSPVVPKGSYPPFEKRLSYQEFLSKDHLSREEIIALSQGGLVENPPVEMGLLPSSLMLGIDEIPRLSLDRFTGAGEVLAFRNNSDLEWFYPMNGGVKPTALLIDSVWQIFGLFLTWSGAAGVGRALGLEKVEIFDQVLPKDRQIIYDVKINKLIRPAGTTDVFIQGDARVFADGRLILSCINAQVGCHLRIRYADYPLKTPMSFGGNLKRKDR